MGRALFFCVFLGSLFVSCSNEKKKLEKWEGCAFQSIVNGALTDDFPSVVRLQLEGTKTCTGTFVSRTTLITARHCLLSASTVKTLNGSSSKFLISDASLDLAVVVFPEDVFLGVPSEISFTPPKGDEPITIVGYGQYDIVHNIPTDGKKRVGCNHLKGFADKTDQTLFYRSDQGQYLHFRSAVNADDGLAMTGKGDSGGPIFIGEKIIGVVSFGGARAQLLSPGGLTFQDEPLPHLNAMYEFDSNLSSHSSLLFLNDAIKKLGATF